MEETLSQTYQKWHPRQEDISSELLSGTFLPQTENTNIGNDWLLTQKKVLLTRDVGTAEFVDLIEPDRVGYIIKEAKGAA